MEKLALSSHYTIKNIIRQCTSPILMMLFISIYGVVDGIFVANFDSADAFAGINLIFPIVFIVGGMGFMFGSGGCALTSKLLGEGKKVDANKVFSMMIYSAFLVGAILSILLFPFIDDFVILLAKISNDATPLMIEKATLYGRILICSQPFYIVGTLFQNFFVVDEKQKVGFVFTVGAGLANMAFDALFIAVFKWGVAGAAVATMIGHLITCIGPILYFQFRKDNLIRLVKTRLNFRIIGRCCFNGLSDFIFNISANIIGLVYNTQMLRFYGQQGVTAYGILMYVSFIALSIFIGLIMGIAPIIGYNYGGKNHKELKNVIKNCFIILAVISLIIFGLAEILATPLAILFAKNNDAFLLSQHAMRIYAFSYLFAGFSIFITGMFTALNNGLVSGLLSLFRSFVFQLIFIFTLPLLFNEEGLWYSMGATELCSSILAFSFYFIDKKKYHY